MTRIARLTPLLTDGVDAVLLTSEVMRRYVSCCDIAEGMLLVGRNGGVYFTDSRYFEAAQKGMPELSVELVTRDNSYPWLLQQIASDWDVHCIGFEEDRMTVAQLQRLQDDADLVFVPMQKQLDLCRQIKEPQEMDCMRRAQEITDKTFSDLLCQIREGITEADLKTELIYRLSKNGGEGLSFDPIVVSGPNSSLPHGVAGSRKLQTGDFVTLDFGCRIGGYCSDMTRTVALGRATEEMRSVYAAVHRAQLAGIAATKAGALGSAIDRAAREVIASAGYGEYFGHSYGHGIGLEVHEDPNCSPSWEKALPAGCVCSAEPGIYLPGKFGVRIEDMVYTTPDGCEILTKSAKSLIIL